MIVIGGRYRHYKGRQYEVTGIAMHSETQEPMVIYRQLYGFFHLWVRPRKMFEETVEVDGKTVPRFELLHHDPHRHLEHDQTGAANGPTVDGCVS